MLSGLGNCEGQNPRLHIDSNKHDVSLIHTVPGGFTGGGGHDPESQNDGNEQTVSFKHCVVFGLSIGV